MTNEQNHAIINVLADKLLTSRTQNIFVWGKHKHTHKHMTNQRTGAIEAPQSSAFSYVYSYLLVGIGLLAAVILLLPRVSIG